MAYLTPLSKALANKAALAAVVVSAFAISACEGPKRDGQDFQRLAAQIQAIDVDGKDAAPQSASAGKTPQIVVAQAEPAQPNDKGLNIIIDTARDMAVGQGGLFTGHNNLKVEVVSPLELDRNLPPPGVVLSEEGRSENTRDAVTGAVSEVVSVAASKAAMTFAERSLSASAPELEVKPASQTVNKGRTIQIGSFSTREGAEAAWGKLTTSHPEMARFNPQMQNIRTNGGKVLVRLKVGPVYTDAEAQVLCDKLRVRDAWCARAG